MTPSNNISITLFPDTQLLEGAVVETHERIPTRFFSDKVPVKKGFAVTLSPICLLASLVFNFFIISEAI